jgi:hypothetical protein
MSRLQLYLLSPPPLHAHDLSPAYLSNKNGGHSRRNCRASNFLLVCPFSSVFSRTFIRHKSILLLRFLFLRQSEFFRECKTVFQVPFCFLRLSSSCLSFLPRFLAPFWLSFNNVLQCKTASHYDVGLFIV